MTRFFARKLHRKLFSAAPSTSAATQRDCDSDSSDNDPAKKKTRAAIGGAEEQDEGDEKKIMKEDEKKKKEVYITLTAFLDSWFDADQQWAINHKRVARAA